LAAPALERVSALDLIRGVAVLGILAVNVLHFSNAPSAVFTPHATSIGTAADVGVFAAILVLFEGKMRALFSMLFGASLLLLTDRAAQTAGDGPAPVVRRLLWLAVIGYLHFLLLWDGDILFLYAIAGLAALPLRHAAAWPLCASGLMLFSLWQAHGLASWWPGVAREQAVLAGTAAPDAQKAHRLVLAERRSADAQAIATIRSGMSAQVASKLRERPFYPLRMVATALGETLSYVLIGMALLRSGFFTGGWKRRQFRGMALAGIGLGGAATLGFATWAIPAHFPELAMVAAISYGLGFPHLLMALGYAALLVLASRGASWLGDRLRAAGRMALTNYLATTLVMTFLFHSWGLGLAGRVPVAHLSLFVLLGWGLMLGWSPLWLRHFRQGPLEWGWRSLVEGRMLPLRR